MLDHRYYGANVKVYNLPDVPGEDELREDEREAIYDLSVEIFWRMLEDRARTELGLEGVWSEGRMGGWAVPNPTIDPEEDPARFARFQTIAEEVRDEITEETYVELMREAIDDLAERREALTIRSNN